MAEALRTDSGPPLPVTGADRAIDRLPDASAVVTPVARSGEESARTWLMGGAITVATVLALGGFFLPWIVIDHGVAGSMSYSAKDLPVGNYIGVAWLLFIVMLASVGWAMRWRWSFAVGALSSFVGILTFFVLAIILSEAPHLVPLWLIPKEARSFVPSVGSGPGPWSAALSCTVFFAWFVVSWFTRRDLSHEHHFDVARSTLSGSAGRQWAVIKTRWKGFGNRAD